MGVKPGGCLFDFLGVQDRRISDFSGAKTAGIKGAAEQKGPNSRNLSKRLKFW